MSEAIEIIYQYQTLKDKCHNDHNCDHCIELCNCPHEKALHLKKLYSHDTALEVRAYFSLKRTVDKYVSQLKYKSNFRNKLICKWARLKTIIIPHLIKKIKRLV